MLNFLARLGGKRSRSKNKLSIRIKTLSLDGASPSTDLIQTVSSNDLCK